MHDDSTICSKNGFFTIINPETHILSAVYQVTDRQTPDSPVRSTINKPHAMQSKTKIAQSYPITPTRALSFVKPNSDQKSCCEFVGKRQPVEGCDWVAFAGLKIATRLSVISAIRAVVLGESESVVAGGRDDPPHLSRANHMLVF